MIAAMVLALILSFSFLLEGFVDDWARIRRRARVLAVVRLLKGDFDDAAELERIFRSSTRNLVVALLLTLPAAAMRGAIRRIVSRVVA